MKVYKFEDYGILPPNRHDRWNVYVCAQESARNRTEQRRKFMVTASQSGFGSWYARRREHFNRIRESLRGPPILIRIPIFKSLEIAKISAGRKCFTRRETISRISIGGDCSWLSPFLRKHDYVLKNLIFYTIFEIV